MTKKLLLIIVVIFTIKSFSQDKKFSFELNYPIPIDNNFIGENYSGIIDLGVDYRFLNFIPINVGVSFNTSALSNNTTQNDGFENYKVTSYVFQPRLFGEFNLKFVKNIRPSVGLGYTIIVFDASGLGNGYDVLNGFNLNFGITYDFNGKFFVQASYDFIGVGVDNDIPNTKYNINILKIGFGYRL